MRKLAYIALTCGILMHSQAHAGCDAKANGSVSYTKAAAFVYTLPEVKAWRKLVYAAGRKVIIMPSMDQQVLINGKCYWSVNLYEDTPTHVTRFNEFYVQVNHHHILVDDVTGGEPITLNQWRSNPSIKRVAQKHAP